MLKDIQNVMNMKRTNSETPDQGVLMNAMSGERHAISKHEDFVIGRALTSSVVLDGLYISRSHCIIKYIDTDQFIIYDNNASTGTFVNCEKIKRGKDNFVVLKHGDLISFGDITKKVDFIYKFCLFSGTEKRPKLDVSIKEESKSCNQLDDVYKKDSKSCDQVDDKFKKSLTDLHSAIMNIKIEELVLKNNIKIQMSQFQEMFVTALEYTNKLKAEQKNRIQELTKQNTEFQESLMNTKKLQELSIESFKDQIFNLAENDFQCPICNEIVVKAHTANCNHTFCHICITTWLGRSKICPICRTNIQTTTNCLALDNFISNLCEQIGGTMKQQRDNLLQERASPLPTAKRGRRRAPGGRRPAFTIDLSNGILQPLMNPHHRYSVGRNGNIEIVDLTTSLTR